MEALDYSQVVLESPLEMEKRFSSKSTPNPLQVWLSEGYTTISSQLTIGALWLAMTWSPLAVTPLCLRVTLD